MSSQSPTPIPFPLPSRPTTPLKPFKSFKILSLDIYGTLIDWESAILSRLQHLASLSARFHSPHASFADPAHAAKLWGLYKRFESELQVAEPGVKYDVVLERVFGRVAEFFGITSTAGEEEGDDGDDDDDVVAAEAKSFGASVGTWPAFPDTVEAMKRLGRYYRLVPLSNVARELFTRTRAGSLAGVEFWRVYTAEDVGRYKPDVRCFEYLFERLDEDDKEEGGEGIKIEEVLHVAQSLFHDHVPAKKVGMSSVWIARRGMGNDGLEKGGWAEEVHEKGEVGYGWRFGSLGEFADAVEREWEGE